MEEREGAMAVVVEERGEAAVTACGEREGQWLWRRERELWLWLHVERERGSGCGGERGSYDDGNERKPTATVRKATTTVRNVSFHL